MRKYDLQNRFIIFGKNIVNVCKKIDWNIINRPLINQLIKSATSIGANYCEAINSSSKKDFRNKLFICKKETEETKFWLIMLAEANKNIVCELRSLWLECNQFVKIFQKSINTVNKKIK